MKKLSTKKLGLLTEIIGYIMTYGSMIALYLFVFFEQVKSKGIFALLGVIILYTIMHFYGKSIYSLYRNYQKYVNNEIDLKRFSGNWYRCLVNSLSFLIPVIIIVFIPMEHESTMSKLFFVLLFTIIPTIPLIPQYLLLHRTNLGFINKNYYTFKKKGDVVNSTIKIKNMKDKLKNLKQEEIIILSIVIGVITALILGYLFGKTIDYNSNGVRTTSSYNRYYSEFNFNYILGVSGFIITSGLTYLFLGKNKN